MLSPVAQKQLNAINELRAHMHATTGAAAERRKERGESR